MSQKVCRHCGFEIEFITERWIKVATDGVFCEKHRSMISVHGLGLHEPADDTGGERTVRITNDTAMPQASGALWLKSQGEAAPSADGRREKWPSYLPKNGIGAVAAIMNLWIRDFVSSPSVENIKEAAAIVDLLIASLAAPAPVSGEELK